MARDMARGPRLEDLTDREIERIEAEAFCRGGPPETLNAHMLWRASLSKAPEVCRGRG